MSLIYSPLMITSDTPDSVYNELFLDGMKRARATIRAALQEFEDYELKPEVGSQNVTTHSPTTVMGDNDSVPLPRKVFIVHGHDNEMKEAVARFFERIGFEPIILHEQPNAGTTVIEKFERNADVQFAVVLLSPDDVGSVNSDKSENRLRARQNVVLELGYFIGRLTRARVCPLLRGKLELPSDMHGIVYVPYEGESWKLVLIKELKHLGFDVDANKAF